MAAVISERAICSMALWGAPMGERRGVTCCSSRNCTKRSWITNSLAMRLRMASSTPSRTLGDTLVTPNASAIRR